MRQIQLFDEEFLPDDQQETLDDYRDPFDSSKVVLYSTDWTVGTVIDQILKRRIELNPSFQRREAWLAPHKSRFIESLILNIPIPQIVLAEDPFQKGYYVVIDGKQRLLSLVQYVQEPNLAHEYKGFKLTGLVGSTGAFNNKLFHELPNEIRAQIENTVLRTVIIRSVGNIQFLYEAFLRLNQGSKPLSPQELRQALAPGQFSDWISEQKLDLISSAILLSFAELEEFVESSVSELLEAAFDFWRYDGRVTTTLLSCLHYMHPAKDKELIANVKSDFSKPVDQIVYIARERSLKLIENNHGLSEDNLTNMLKMVGVDITAISSEITVISNYTKTRGAIAHSGHKSHGVTLISSPNAVKTDINNVMSAIEVIAESLVNLKQKCGSGPLLKKARLTLPAI